LYYRDIQRDYAAKWSIYRMTAGLTSQKESFGDAAFTYDLAATPRTSTLSIV